MVLEDVSASTLSGRKVNVSRGIKEQMIVHQNAALVGTRKTAEAIEYECFSGAAWAEDSRDACLGAQMHVQLK